MQVILNCQRCNGALTITPEMGGQVFACPYCAQPFTAPQLYTPQQPTPAAPSHAPPPNTPPPHAAPPAAPPQNAKPPVLPPVITTQNPTPVYPAQGYPAQGFPTQGFPKQYNAAPGSHVSNNTGPSPFKRPRYNDELNIGLGITAAVIWLMALGLPVISMPFSGGSSYITILKWQLQDGIVNSTTVATFLIIGSMVLTVVCAVLKKFPLIGIAAIMAFVSLLITFLNYRHPSVKYGVGMLLVLIGALVAIAAAMVRVRKRNQM